MAGTEIEKKSLEAHVELCAERYNSLDTKLNNLETRMDKVENHLVDIKTALNNQDTSQYRTLITIGTTIIGVLITGLITLGVHIATK
jgi:chaperonin cofactor prefoldin